MRLLFAVLYVVLFLARAAAMDPTDHWLRYYGLERWQVVFDQDGDGATAEEEFNYGTDPLDPLSRPPHFEFAADELSFQITVTACPRKGVGS